MSIKFTFCMVCVCVWKVLNNTTIDQILDTDYNFSSYERDIFYVSRSKAFSKEINTIYNVRKAHRMNGISVRIIHQEPKVKTSLPSRENHKTGTREMSIFRVGNEPYRRECYCRNVNWRSLRRCGGVSLRYTKVSTAGAKILVGATIRSDGPRRRV